MWRECTDIDECKEYGGLCRGNVHCTNTVGSYTCGCWTGYEAAQTGCIDIDECTNKDSCPENSVCENSAGNYTCQCHSGFQGHFCEDIDECSLTSRCDANATCYNSEGSYKCYCTLGFHGDGKTCEIGQCDDRSCPDNQKCISPTTNECECREGFSPGENADFCNDIDECLPGRMAGYICDDSSTCHNSEGSYTCTCNSGFFGDGKTCKEGSCTNDICPSNEQCVSPRTSDCRCKDGFERNATFLCDDINECSNNNNTCDQLADCFNTDGSYECKCRQGSYGDGQFCFEGSCTDSICSVNEKCLSPTTVDCECMEGFSLNELLVCVDVDECEADSCDVNAQCTNAIGNFSCSCNIGYSGDGFSCTDTRECDTGIHNCHERAECTNTNGSFSCSCENGFTGNGTSCLDSDECTGTDVCHPNATCWNTFGSYSCVCEHGFAGPSCSDVDECRINAHDCSYGAKCQNTIGSFSCSCKSGVGESCRSNWILLLDTFRNDPLLIDGNGKYKPTSFTFGSKTSITACSMVWRGTMFMFGGDQDRRQIYVVDQCQLKQKGKLGFDVTIGACAQSGNVRVFICFADYSAAESKKCRSATGPMNEFSELASSTYGHTVKCRN